VNEAYQQEETEYQQQNALLCRILRHPAGAKLMNNFAGGNRSNVGPSMLDALAEELMLLSHYCAVMPEGEQHSALQFLENVLLRMSSRADQAATIAAIELGVARKLASEASNG
jgi:hypothetical protein